MLQVEGLYSMVVGVAEHIAIFFWIMLNHIRIGALANM